MSNEFKTLLEVECSPFVNPMGASSTFINNKTAEIINILDSWESLGKAIEHAKKVESSGSSGNSSQISGSQGNSNAIIASSTNPIEVLSMAGINPEDLAEIKSCCAEANKIADIGRNYGKEVNNDFLTRIANAQTFLNYKGLNSSSGCNWISTIFNISSGLGKTLLSAIGLEVGNLNSMIGRIKGWIDLAIQNASMVNDIVSRIMNTYQNVKEFISNIKQNIKDLSNQLKQAIQSEIQSFKEMLAYNARMALANVLGTYANDPCISGVIGNFTNSAFKRLF